MSYNSPWADVLGNNTHYHDGYNHFGHKYVYLLVEKCKQTVKIMIFYISHSQYHGCCYRGYLYHESNIAMQGKLPTPQ